MTRGFYTVTEAQVAKYSPSLVMDWAEMYSIDTDDDIEEIRKQVCDTMSRRTRDDKITRRAH